ncbi:MAG: hypothetical protein JHC95_19325 [Solirubrobacteraceae bacterium]|nr:hypothetical protein [Solirubrobacteraceae bacterium]
MRWLLVAFLALGLALPMDSAAAPEKKRTASAKQKACLKKAKTKKAKKRCKAATKPAKKAPAAKPKPSAPAHSTPAPAPADSAPAPSETPSTQAPPAAGGGGTTPEPNAIGVKAYDRSGTFTLETTRATVRPGALSVNFHNFDSDDHNLWIEGVSPFVSPLRLSAEIGHHGDVTADMTVSTGTYRFFCTVPGHGSMTRTITVSG